MKLVVSKHLKICTIISCYSMSRVTNFVGILSQGLRIAPPEAPVTGYMFGKALYFADVVSKSFNYCRTDPHNTTGIMLLGQVALGDTHDLLQAQYMDKPPKGKHSTKGCGKTIPDPKQNIFIDNGKVCVPSGTTVQVLSHSALLYNEYMVYSVDQVKLRYLLRIEARYK